jgi:hypothetical protein
VCKCCESQQLFSPNTGNELERSCEWRSEERIIYFLFSAKKADNEESRNSLTDVRSNSSLLILLNFIVHAHINQAVLLSIGLELSLLDKRYEKTLLEYISRLTEPAVKAAEPGVCGGQSSLK